MRNRGLWRSGLLCLYRTVTGWLFSQVREYHRRHPNVREAITADDPEEYLKEEPYIDFSGEVISWIFSCCIVSSPSTDCSVE